MNLIPFALSVGRRHWRLALIAIVLLALTIQTFRLSATQGALEAETAARQADATGYALAQAEATALALADKLTREKQDARNAQLAQADYDALRDRYAGLVRAKAAGGAPGHADLPGAAQATGVPADSAGGAGVPFGSILIDTADALICAENTAYAQAAHGWAVGIGGGNPNAR